MLPVEHQGDLRNKGIQQIALGRSERAAFSETKAQNARYAFPSQKRKMQTLGCGKRIGAAPGRLPMLIGPGCDALLFLRQPPGAGEVRCRRRLLLAFWQR